MRLKPLFELDGVIGIPEEPPRRHTLKEQIGLDIDAVFLNILEFAEVHTIGEKEILCVLDEEGAETRSAHWEGGSKQSFDDGIYKTVATLYVKVEDYGPMPKAGGAVILDGKRIYTVSNCTKQGGMYVIGLERVRQ